MIIDIVEKEPHIFIYINTKGKKELDLLMQLAIYRPNCEIYENVQKKIINTKKCNKLKQGLRQTLKQEYFISKIEEYPNYYYDITDKNIYRITWRKQKYDKIDLPIGTKLYHLARASSVDKILKEGLMPSKYSTDGTFYGCNKIFFITKPVLTENDKNIDSHLYNRVQLELTYDGNFELYKDFEYSHIGDNPMVYCIIDRNIMVDGISEIQPIKYNLKLA